MAVEHIIKIRLQFEELDTKEMIKQKTAYEKMSKGPIEASARIAKAGGSEAIEVMTSFQKSWIGFDWAHPIRSIQQLFHGFVESMQSRFGKVVIGIAALVGSVLVKAFRQSIDAQDQLVKMYAQLPAQITLNDKVVSRFGEKISRSLQDISGLAIQTGAAMGELAGIYTSLGKIRVPTNDLKEMTKLSYLGAKALGANVDQMGELMGMLRVQGRLTPTQLGEKGILGEFLKVQSAVGLTENEMSGLITSVSKTTQRMTAFGTKQKDIIAMATATAKLTGLFGQLGLGADRASQMMDRLMDPSQIGENALMIRSMGFSMKEYMNMLAGGAVDQEKFTQGTLRAAQQILNMQKSGVNAFALQQRAQMMGFANAQEALRLASDEGKKTLSDMGKGTADLQKQAAEGMSSLKEAWSRLGNVFSGTLAKPLAGIMGRLTDLMVKFGEILQKRGPEIDKFLTKIFNSLMEWVDKLDFQKIGEGIGRFFDFLGKGVKVLPKLLPLLGGLTVAFGAFKILKPIMGLFGGSSKLLGGLTDKLKGLFKLDLKKGLGQATQGFKSLGKGLEGMLKLVLAGVAMLLIAGAIFVLALALEKFNKISWESLAKGMIALLALSGVMIALGLFFSTVGVGVLIGIVAFSAAMLILSTSMLLFATALNLLDPDRIAALGAVASPSLIKQFLQLGLAFTALGVAIGPFMLLKAPVIMMLGKALKDLAVGLYVLSKTPDVKALGASLKGVSEAVNTMGKMQFRGRAAEIGAGFKDLAGSVIELTKIDVSKFANLGGAMTGLGEGLSTWMDSMKKGAGFKFLGIGKDISAATKGFKDLSVGVYLLGEASAKMPGIVDLLNRMPPLITGISDAMDRFGRSSKASNDFVNLLQALQTIKTMEFAAGVPTEVPVTGRLEGVTGTGTMDITAAYAAETAKVIEAINVLSGIVRDQTDNQLAQLANIARYTRIISRT